MFVLTNLQVTNCNSFVLFQPKYIQNLLKAAEVRKKEQERRTERQVQKDREKEEEAGEFRDKEKFVTSAYKKKMLERQKELEEEQRQAALEGKQLIWTKSLMFIYTHMPISS